MYSTGLLIYRWNEATDGLIAIPSGCFFKEITHSDNKLWPSNQPGTPYWYWRDANGNGKVDTSEVGNYNYNKTFNYGDTWAWWVDSDANIWIGSESSAIAKIPLVDFDAMGNPIYDPTKQMVWTQHKQYFQSVERLEYHADTDTMWIGGFRPKSKPISWGLAGDIVLGFENWSTNPTLKYNIGIPHDQNNMPKSISCWELSLCWICDSRFCIHL